MLAYLEGTVLKLDPAAVVVLVNGIGYEVRISLTTYQALVGKTTVKLWTYFQVREDAHILYGFIEQLEKVMFMDLLSVSGVGGNTALMILSGMGLSDLKHALATADVGALKRIKGVGEKTAARIILELKNRLPNLEGEQTGFVSATRSEAIAALVSLGLSKTDAEKKIDAALKANPTADVTTLIKAGLKS